MKPRVLVLGGLGFVGKNLVEHLVKDNHEILVIDSNVHGLNWYSDTLEYQNSQLRVELFDCSDISRLEKAIVEFVPHEIYHLAANSDIGNVNSVQVDFYNTLNTTLALCEVIRHLKLQIKIIFASTSAIYGNLSRPITLNPNSLMIPVSSYGWAKRASELSLLSVCSDLNIDLLIARFPNVVGPGLTHGLLFDVYNKILRGDLRVEILGDGTQFKPFVHVVDLIEIIQRQKSDANLGRKVINISPLDQISVRDIVNEIQRCISPKINFTFQNQREGWQGDVPEYSFDISESELNGSLIHTTSRDAILRSLNEYYKL